MHLLYFSVPALHPAAAAAAAVVVVVVAKLWPPLRVVGDATLVHQAVAVDGAVLAAIAAAVHGVELVDLLKGYQRPHRQFWPPLRST